MFYIISYLNTFVRSFIQSDELRSWALMPKCVDS